MEILPTVTVIIPSYNHANFLQEALSSLIAQTFTNWEAIVVNNYSTDNTIEIVNSFADPRIQLENFKNDGIIAASRNRALALARGQYIAFLDSDDTWEPLKLEKCLKAFTPDIDIVSHALAWFGERSGILPTGPKSRATFEALLYDGSCMTPSATVIRTSVIRKVGGFSEDKDFVTAEDYHLWLKLSFADVRIRFLNDVLGHYRLHGASQSSSSIRHMNAVIHVVNSFSGNRSGARHKRRLQRRYSQIYYGAARSMQRSGALANAQEYFLKAIRTYPCYVKSYIGLAINIAKSLAGLRKITHQR